MDNLHCNDTDRILLVEVILFFAEFDDTYDCRKQYIVVIIIIIIHKLLCLTLYRRVQNMSTYPGSTGLMGGKK